MENQKQTELIDENIDEMVENINQTLRMLINRNFKPDNEMDYQEENELNNEVKYKKHDGKKDFSC